MIKMETVLLAQAKANERKAIEYSNSIRRERKIRRIRKVAIGILMATFFVVAFGIVGSNDLETEAKGNQKYTVRYGTMETEDSILTRDGNLWLLSEPEYEIGTKVRVLFDSKGTASPLDDIILNVTER